MKIAVIDLKINNYKSVLVALSRVISENDEVTAIENGNTDFDADLIILPGLGHFSSGMKALESAGLDRYIKKYNESGSKIVGICLGMQLLGISSEEAPGVQGLNLVEAFTKKLPPVARNPHIGWSSVQSRENTSHFPTLSTGKDFYFVHSYHVEVSNHHEILTSTSFGPMTFTSSILSENIAGFQFHPEKSGKVGNLLLGDIYSWASSSR
jgi:glutamine amidotransferase